MFGLERSNTQPKCFLLGAVLVAAAFDGRMRVLNCSAASLRWTGWALSLGSTATVASRAKSTRVAAALASVHRGQQHVDIRDALDALAVPVQLFGRIFLCLLCPACSAWFRLRGDCPE
jgi:hypothetical protein